MEIVKNFVFQIVERFNSKETIYLLQAINKAEMNDWILAIKKGSQSRGGPVNVKHTGKFLEKQFRDLISTEDPMVEYTNFKKIGEFSKKKKKIKSH